MKVWIVGEQTSSVTFNYTELTEREKQLIIDGLISYRESDQDMRNYDDPERVQEAKEINLLLGKIK